MYSQPDVGILAYNSPISGCNVGSATKSINVIVQNYTNIPVSPGNITVRYQVNSGPIISQTITTFLLGNTSYNFTFSVKQNLSACSQWNIKTWTSYGADVNPSNDTLTTLFKNDCNPIPAAFSGPSLLCQSANNDSILLVGGTFSYGLVWNSQVLPGGFTSTGVTTDKFYLNNLSSPTNYQVVYAGGLCPNVTSPTYSVDLSPPLNVGTVSPDLNLCANNVVGDVSLSGFVNQINAWQESTDGITWTSTGSNANPYSITTYTDTTYFRALVSSGACGTGFSDTVAVNIEPVVIPGTITGATTVCENVNSGTLTLSGYANAASLEWYTSTDNITFNPTGVFTNTYSYLNLAQTTYFKVVLANNLCPNVETPVVTILVDPALDLGTTSSNLVVCSNNITGNVSVSGFTSNILDWVYSTNGGLSWTSTGSNSNPYDISGISSSTDFKAIIQSGVCGSDSTNSISVTIEPAVVPGTISGSTTVCEGVNSGSFVLSGNANETSYEWYSSTDNITFTPTGITSNTFNYSNYTVTTYFKVILQGNTCPTVETAVAVLTVDPALNTGVISANQTYCSNNVIGTISLSSFSNTITDWIYSTNSGATWTSTGSNSNPYNIAGTLVTTDFRAIVESGTCGSDTSGTVTITIEPEVIAGSISGATTVCSSANSGTLTLSGHANETSFEWFTSLDNITFTPTGINASTYNFTNLAATTYFKVVLQGNSCPTVETPVVIVTVDPALNTGSISPNQTFCSNNVVGTISLSGFTNTITDWIYSTNSGLTWTSSGSNANPFSINGTAVTTDFRAIVESGTCGSDTSGTVTITIEPEVIAGTISGAATICEGANSGTLTLAGNANESSFEWYISSDNVTFSPTGISTSTFNYSNLTTTTYYKVILQGSACPAVETPVITMVVDPAINIGSPSADLNFCSDNVVGTISITGFISTLTDWEQSIDGGTTWTSTASSANPYSINGITTSTLYRALIGSGVCGTAYSDTISVDVEPTIVTGTLSGATTVCASGNSGTLTLTGNANDFGFEWYTSTDNITFTPSGVTTANYNFSNLTQTSYFKVVLFGNICSDVETATILVNVDPVVNVGTPSPDLDLCADNVVGSISLSSIVGNIVNWETSTNSGATWSSTGSTSNPYSITGLSTSSWFRALIGSGSCGTQYSDTISVSIEPVIIPGSIDGDTTVCSGTNSGTLVHSGNLYDTGFEWFTSTDNITFTATGVTTSTYNFLNLTQTTYYKVVLPGAICSDVETPVVTITVDPNINLGVTSPDLFLCESNITGNVSLSGAVTLFDWEQSNDNGFTWVSTGDNNPVHDISALTSTAWFRGLVSSGTCGSGYSDTIAVTIEPSIIPGSISSDSTVCAAFNSGVLTLTGNSYDFGYEWYTSTDNLTFTATGITGPNYSYSGLSVTTYYKVILFGNNCNDDETNVITITVDSALNKGNASSDLVLCENNIVGTISLTGAVNLMDWEISTDGGTTWTSTGISTSAYDISTLSTSALFRGYISSGVCGSTYSDTISVDIEPLIIPGVISSDTTVCATSNSGSLNLSGNSNDFGFEWYSSTDNITFSPTGITTPTFNYSGLSVTTYYKVILFGNICTNDETNVITITVDSSLNPGVASADLVLCQNNITGIISVTGAMSFMDWEISNDNGTTWTSTGISTNTYNISSLTASALFRGFISSGACGSTYSDTISVVIEPSIVSGSISSDTTVCATSNSGVLTLSGNNYDFGYEWYTSTDNITFTATGITTATYNYSGLLTTTYVKVILQGNICNDEETDVVTITVDPSINTGLASSDITLCENNITGLISINGAVNFMDWEISNDGGTTWLSTSTSVNTYDISTLTASALFRGLITSGACGSSYSDTISVTIEPEIIIGTLSNDTSVCSGINSGNLVLTGNANDFGIEWYSSLDGTTFTPTGVTTNTYSFSNLTQTTYFKVILQGNICSDEETSILTVTVDSILNLGLASADLELCSNNIVGAVQLTGAVSIMDWEQSTNAGATWTSTGDYNASHNISTITTTSWFRAFISSGACGSGYSDTIIVNIEQPIVPGTISGTSNVCSGINSGSLSLTGNLNDLGYQWFISTDNVTFTPTGISTSTYNFSNLTQTTYVKVILTGNACNDAETTVHTIVVDPPLNLGTPSADLLLCESNIIGSVSITGAVTLQDWMQSNDGGITWFSTGDNNTSHSIVGLTNSALFQAVISSGACGTGVSSTISVQIDPVGVPAVIGYDFTTCIGNGDTNNLQVISHNGNIGSWQKSINGITWSILGISDSIIPISNLLLTTQYQLITNHGACPNTLSNIVTGNIATPPVANAGIDQTVALGASIQLNGSGGLFGVWTPPTFLTNPTTPSPLCTPLVTIPYAYTVIDANGCTNTDYVVIKVDSTITPIEKDGIQIYNILTLNGDGLNDYFVVKGLEVYENNTVKIFNGNGNLLYSQKDYQSDWDGTYRGVLLPDGVYLYTIEVSNVTKHRGFITIIRSE